MANWADKEKSDNLPSLSECFERAQTELISLFDEIEESDFKTATNITNIYHYLLGMVAGQYIATENPKKYSAIGLISEFTNFQNLESEMNSMMKNGKFSRKYAPKEVNNRLEGLKEHIQILLGHSSGLPPITR